MGYDVSNFTAINPIFGTMSDFKTMVNEAHKLGLKIIMDFVPNHSSSKHLWFREALKGPTNKYHNYYVWSPGRVGGANISIPEEGGSATPLVPLQRPVERREPSGIQNVPVNNVTVNNGAVQPPNNWRSAFNKSQPGSAWTYVTTLGKYYLHQFHQAQPDLDYRNPDVVMEMQAVLQFWTQQGVDGFRVDAVPYLVEDYLLRDNPPGSRSFQRDQDETYQVVRMWRDTLDRLAAAEGKDMLLMVEAYANTENTMRYYGTWEEPRAHFPMNFYLMGNFSGGNDTAREMALQIIRWELNKPFFGWHNWVIGNHDTSRVGSRLGPELIDAMNMLVLLLPGTAITYNGEELGMLDNKNLTVRNCADPQACPEGLNTTNEYYMQHTRDFERTPFQWNTTANSGFTNGTPWLQVNSNFNQINVEVEQNQENSHLAIYVKLVNLRQEPVFQAGLFLVSVPSENVLVFVRYNATDKYIVVLNLGNKAESFNVSETLEVVVSSNYSGPSSVSERVQLGPYACVVLKGRTSNSGGGVVGGGGAGGGGTGEDGGNWVGGSGGGGDSNGGSNSSGSGNNGPDGAGGAAPHSVPTAQLFLGMLALIALVRVW